jgi:hypothetical protein
MATCKPALFRLSLPCLQSPLALVSSAPEQRVLPALEAAGLLGRFDAVVTADDVHRGQPDPEGYLYAAQKMARPPLRCVVIGSSNLSIEAAHEARLLPLCLLPNCTLLDCCWLPWCGWLNVGSLWWCLVVCWNCVVAGNAVGACLCQADASMFGFSATCLPCPLSHPLASLPLLTPLPRFYCLTAGWHEVCCAGGTATSV